MKQGFYHSLHISDYHTHNISPTVIPGEKAKVADARYSLGKDGSD